MQGQLFTQDFLTRGVTETPPHQALSDSVFADFSSALQSIFKGLDGASTLNEAQTEQMVINKVLVALGWGDDTLPQVNLSGKRREDVPDVLLFANAAAKASASCGKISANTRAPRSCETFSSYSRASLSA